MKGSRNFAAGNGTLAGAPVTLTPPSGGAEAWVIFNDHASNTYDFALGGQTVKVKPGEALFVPVFGSSATLDGTGAYRWLALDDAGASQWIRDAASPTGALADAAVTTAKLADDSVTAAKIAADAVGSSEIAAGAVGTSELADAAVTDPKRKIAKASALAAAGDQLTGIIAGNTGAFATKHTISANKLKVGSVIRVRGAAVMTTKGGGSAQTEQVFAKVGSTVIGAATAALNGAANDVMLVDAEVVVRAIGAAGKFCGWARYSFGHEGAGTVKESKSVTVDGAIDTTGALDVTCGVTFAADAAAGDIMDLVSLTVSTTDITA